MRNKPPAKAVVSKHVVNVGVNALAREVGMSPTAVSKNLRRGKTADEIRAAGARRAAKKGPVKGAPDKPAARKSYGAPPKESEYDLVIASHTRSDELEEWKLRRQKALAERQEIENMLRRGELMPISYARQWGIRFLVEGRDELLKGPSEYADALAAEDDPLKCAAIMRGWLERAMAKFEQLRMLWEGEAEAERVA